MTRLMGSGHRFAAALLVLLASWAGPTLAAKARGDIAADTAQAGQVITRSFAEMGAGREPLRLNTWQAGYVLKLPVSPREVLTGARVRLQTANSTALIRSRSELSVRVNGTMLAQYPLDPQDTLKTRDIDIPVELLRPGYNDIFFNVVQHYTYDCEDPASPELWTEINPLNSSVTMAFNGLRPNLQPRLTQMHIAFDKRAWIPRPLAVVTGTEHVSEAQLAAAALVTQGIGLRMGFRPLDVEVYSAATGASLQPEPTRFPGLSSAVTRGRDVVLVGRRSELSRYLDAELHGLLGAGPFVGVFSHMNGESVVIVVSGNTDEELMTAARALAEPDFKFSDVPMEAVKDKWAFKQQPVLVTDEPMHFSAFGFRTTGTRGVKVQPLTFEFRAPADFGAKKGDLATVRLHFSYGAGLRKDSSMVVKLNGEFAVAVPLNEPAGAEFQKYELRVPAQFVRPGYNTLTFEPVFQQHKDRCDMAREEGLVLTIYEDSSFELPGATVVPKAPDLARFSTGLWPLDNTLRMYVTQRDTKTAAAALTLAASLAQKNRAPFEVELRYSPFENGHMLAVGPHGGLADFVATALPLRQYTWSAEGSQAALMQAVEGRRVITAFVSSEPEVLRRAVHVMDRKGLWQGIEGKASIVDTVENTVINEPATEQVDFGSVNRLSVSVSSWKVMGLWAVGLAALFAMAFVAVLRQLAAKRQRESDQKGK